jgi:uncharacterized iron-regulated protein
VTGASRLVGALLGLGLASSCAGAEPAAATPKAAPVPADVVARSALPLSFRFHGAHTSEHDLLAALAPMRAVCIGESHDDPHHHYAEWQLTRALLEAHAGRPAAVGFEMFQTPFQSALDSYRVTGDAAALVRQSEYEQRWGFPFPYYAPLLEAGRAAGADLLALNAPRELSQAVAKHGIEALPASERALLPQLDLDNREHRAFFEAAMGMKFGAAAGSSPHAGLSLENLYAAQVTWDETMATMSAGWLGQQRDGLLIIIAGSAHCQRTAIPARIERRGPSPVVAARALRTSELGKSDAPADDAFDLLLVLDDGGVSLSAP